MSRRRPRILLAIAVALGLVAAAWLAVGVLIRGPVVLRAPHGERRDVSAARLERDVRTLVEELSPRWYRPPEREARVADWIAARLEATGLEVTEQRYSIPEGTYRNVLATRRGTDPGRGAVLVGAHYDAYGDLPGADDNASGVAVLLELARTLPPRPSRRTVILAAFANEEPPFFSSEEMGSCGVARRLRDDGTSIELMIALDLVGFYSDEPGSQRLPAAWLRPFYPSAGNFIGVVGDTASGRAIARVKRGLRSTAAIPVLSFRAPRALPGVDWSDHFWFRELGMPAVLVTDTAMMRNPNYHRRSDTPETLDFRRMAEVVQGLHGVLQDE